MAFRTTPEDVVDVLAPGGDYAAGKPLLPFMTVGNNLVDWLVANAAAYGRTPPNATEAKTLETWLAAWAYKCSDQQLASKTQGRSSGSFRGATGGKRFDMNNYGSAAMAMDTSGLLNAINDRRIATTAWLGKPVADMLTWEERNE